MVDQLLERWAWQSARLYVDGGVIGKNPSTHGGTWAVVLVSADDTTELARWGGRIEAAECPYGVTTNNVSELWAALSGLEQMPAEWDGPILSDSFVTLSRLLNPKPGLVGLDTPLIDRLFIQKRKHNLAGDRAVLLDGHPTRLQLSIGIGKRGNPCSRWNALADRICNELKEGKISL